MGYTIQQKWSISKHKMLKQWEVRNTKTGRLLHTTRSYANAVKWIRKKAK